MEPDEKDQDPATGPTIDTEGGSAHLTEVIAVNTLKEIIGQAKEMVEEEEGRFVIPSEVQDNLLVLCERVLLNYGEIEAKNTMKEELLEYLRTKRALKERDDERKIKDRLPSDTKRE